MQGKSAQTIYTYLNNLLVGSYFTTSIPIIAALGLDSYELLEGRLVARPPAAPPSSAPTRWKTASSCIPYSSGPTTKPIVNDSDTPQGAGISVIGHVMWAAYPLDRRFDANAR